MVALFAGLLAFHLWLLYRMVSARNLLLVALLLVAIGLFGWRIVHYWNLRGGREPGRARREPAEERRQIVVMGPVLAGLLVLHAWLISVTLAEGETAFAVLLLVAVVVFVVRLGYYARRLLQLRAEARGLTPRRRGATSTAGRSGESRAPAAPPTEGGRS